MKATSQVALYKNNADMMASCVFYKAGEAMFERDTAVQPDNQFPVPHADIAKANRTGTFRLLGQLPKDFHERLVQATKSSVRATPAQKKRLLGLIGAMVE